MKKILLIGVLITILSGAANAQHPEKEKLDSLLTVFTKNQQFMGSLTITENGVPFFSRNYGFEEMNGQNKVPATEVTEYRIGSVTKLFTAVMIFELIDENKITLQTTVDHFFPTVPNAKKITIGNLLNHHGGLSDIKSIKNFTEWIQTPKTEEELLQVISKSDIDFEPGTKAAYSNSGFMLLGYIIEKICRRSYATLLQERICDKIGLRHTFYSPVRNTHPHESYSYAFHEGWKSVTETDWSIPCGAGGIISTTTDMTQFITLLFNGDLISPNSLVHMKTIKDDFGMDLVQMDFDGHPGFGHTGRMDGFWTTLTYFPENSVAIAYCANGQQYPMTEIMQSVLTIYFRKSFTPK